MKKKTTAPYSKGERRLNYVINVVIHVAALALGALSVAGYATHGLELEQAFGMLAVAFVLAMLAGLQETFAINRLHKVLDEKNRRPNSTNIQSSSDMSPKK